MFPVLISVGFDALTKSIRNIVLPVILIMIIFAVQCSSESCYQYRRKANVTIDTDQCLWENYTEPKSKRFCLESCFEKATVRIVRFIITKSEEILSGILLRKRWIDMNQSGKVSAWNLPYTLFGFFDNLKPMAAQFAQLAKIAQLVQIAQLA